MRDSLAYWDYIKYVVFLFLTPSLGVITDLFKETVEVNMHTVSTLSVKQNVLPMAITKTKDITHHTHDR